MTDQDDEELDELSKSDVPLKIKSMLLYEKVERLAFKVTGTRSPKFLYHQLLTTLR